MATSAVSFHNLDQPVHTPKKDWGDVTFSGLSKDKFKAAAKATYVAIDLMREFDKIPEDYEGPVAETHHYAKIIKLAHAPGDTLNGLNELRHTVVKFSEDSNRWTFLAIMRKISSLLGAVYDSLDLLTRTIVYLPKECLYRGANGIALLFGMTCNAVERLYKVCHINLNKSKNTQELDKKHAKVTEHMIKLAWAVSYVALGVLIVLSEYFGIVVASLYFTLCSASTVSFDLIGYYHKQLGTERV